MNQNFVRTPEDLIEDLLQADGWDFSGFGLYKRKDRNRNESCNKEKALRETLSRHQYDEEASMYDVFGDNPTDDQILEALRVVRLIIDPADKIIKLEQALSKIKERVEATDGRVQDDFDFITKTANDTLAIMEMDRNRREMRSDFRAI